MSSLLNLLPTTKYGFQGKTPPTFDLGPNSTLDNQSSLNGNPPFSSYSDAFLRKQQATKLAPSGQQLQKYLDNPPQ